MKEHENFVFSGSNVLSNEEKKVLLLQVVFTYKPQTLGLLIRVAKFVGDVYEMSRQKKSVGEKKDPTCFYSRSRIQCGRC